MTDVLPAILNKEYDDDTHFHICSYVRSKSGPKMVKFRKQNSFKNMHISSTLSGDSKDAINFGLRRLEVQKCLLKM